MVLVELETANNAHVKGLCFILSTATVSVLALGVGDQEGHKKSTLASFDKQHPLHCVRISCLRRHSAAVVESTELVVGTTAKMVQVQVVERLADVVEVEASLSLSKHFYKQTNLVSFSIKMML